jgi:hypothetical protein
MSELGIIPFRIPSKMNVKPIELDLIPECGAMEMSRLRQENQEITTRIAGLGVQKSDAVARKTFLAMIVLTVLLVVVGAGLQYFTIAIGIALAILGTFVSFVTAAYASLAYVKSPDEDEVTRELLARRTSQELRLTSLISLERLTGKIGCAKDLRIEADQFNANLVKLDTEDCSAADRAMIAERRFDLSRRIGDLRQKVLGAPHEPLLLPKGNDDRER